jgi:hypothetical protein
MTRKEQVTNKVKEIVHESRYNAIPSTLFEMTTWADKTMIEKACEWLKENIWIYINYEGCSGEELENDIIEDFRKAMEE